MPVHDSASIARTNMVETQLRTNRVTDPDILHAFLNTPREQFLPEALKPMAYLDGRLNLGDGRCFIEPLVQAQLISDIGLTETSRVLVVGSGTGYVTAIIAQLVGQVVAVEPHSELYLLAATMFATLALGNVTLLSMPLTEGCADQGPYDAIVIEGAVTMVPDTILHQLAEGGKLATILRPAGAMGHGVLVERVDGKFSQRTTFDANVPYLPGFEPKPEFEFAR